MVVSGNGPFMEVQLIRFAVLWGLYWGPPLYRNYHVLFSKLLASGSAARAYDLGLPGLGFGVGILLTS